MKKPTSFVEAASLSGTELFAGLPRTCLRALEEGSEVREFKSGHVFFRSGQRGEMLFVIERGHVQTFRTSGGKKLIIAELGPPAVFGEMACVGQSMYYCSAQTTEPARIRIISTKQLEKLLEDFPALTRRLLDLVSQRFVNVLLELEATSFKQLVPRLAALLLAHEKDGVILGFTHEQIAELLRVYRESATFTLGELRKAGIVAVERKRIRILDRTRLERAARE